MGRARITPLPGSLVFRCPSSNHRFLATRFSRSGPKTASALHPNRAWLQPCRRSIPKPATGPSSPATGRFDGIFLRRGQDAPGSTAGRSARRGRPGAIAAASSARPPRPSATGFRACLRCRPELAPGDAPVDALSRLVAAAVRGIEAGRSSTEAPEVDELAAAAGRLRPAPAPGDAGRARRLAGPADQSRRLALARQLIADTALPLTEVAFASGFRQRAALQRRVRERFGSPPSAMRRTASRGNCATARRRARR